MIGFSAVFFAAAAMGLTLPEYYIVIFASAIAFGLLAAATDLTLGYGGVLNLGPAISFGVGSYVFAVCQRDELAIVIALPLVAIIGATMFALFAFIGLSNKRSTIQFALFTLVASISFEQIAISSTTFLGGSNGIPNIVPPLELGLRLYYYVFLVFCGLLAAGLIFIQLRFENLLILQRDAPEKAESLGYNPKRIKVRLKMVGGGVGALAGALYVPFSGIAYPGQFAILPNLLVLVWIALGGRATLIGPFAAAVVLSLIQFELGSANSNLYMLVLGSLFVLVVSFAPLGLWPRALRRH